MKRVLITGAGGQIGQALVPALLEVGYQVLATDIRPLPYATEQTLLDVTDAQALHRLIRDFRPHEIYHLAAYLSAKSEEQPHAGWKLNFEASWNLLEIARELGVEKVFWASSIAAFGPNTPRQKTPQYPPMDPIGLYGIAKLAVERLGEYYFWRYGLDVRSLRFPGVVGPGHLPQGGTTDFAVHMFYAAPKGHYSCYLLPDTRLPMIYITDAIRAILELMQAPAEKISVRSAYNLHGLTFSPGDLEREIQKHYPAFRCTYEPDFRQKLAESWPESIDDNIARRDWGWQPQYDLARLTQAMFEAIAQSV